MSLQFTATTSADQGQQNQASPSPPRVLGDAWNGMKRRFVGRLTQAQHANDDKAGTACSWSKSQLLSEITAVAEYIRYFPRAEVLEFKVRTIFCAAATDNVVDHFLCMTQSRDAIPAKEEDFFAAPTTEYTVSQSIVKGALPPQLASVPILGNYGVGRQIKPPPVVGGDPRITVGLFYAPIKDVPRLTPFAVVLYEITIGVDSST